MSMWFSPLCLLVVFIKVKLPHRQRLGERGSFFLMNAPDFPCGSAGKESACSEGDLASIPGLGRSPVRGKGYTPQYFGLENSKDCIVHGWSQTVRHDWAAFTFTFQKDDSQVLEKNSPVMWKIYISKEKRIYNSKFSWESKGRWLVVRKKGVYTSCGGHYGHHNQCQQPPIKANLKPSLVFH